MTTTNTAATAAKAAQTTAPVAATPATSAPKVDLAKPGTEPKAPEAAKPATTEAAPATPAPEAPKPDPFATLPRIKLGETADVLDMSGVETSNPYKYAKVVEDALVDKLPMRRGWKHATAMFVPGTNKGGENGYKAGSVYGTIADIVTRAGRSGIAAHELVTMVRQRQIGNKRSKYCDKLPPVGWAEGWIDTAVTKNIVGIHATRKAPAIFPVAAPAPAPADTAKPADGKALPAPASKGADKAPATKAA